MPEQHGIMVEGHGLGKYWGPIWDRTGVHFGDYPWDDGIPLLDVRFWVGDNTIIGVGGGGDVTGVTPAPPGVSQLYELL